MNERAITEPLVERAAARFKSLDYTAKADLELVLDALGPERIREVCRRLDTMARETRS